MNRPAYRPLAFILLILSNFCLASLPLSAADYRLEQEIDRLAGLLNRPWNLDKIRTHTRARLPRELVFGLPPYDQQPEKAQTLPKVPKVIKVKPPTLAPPVAPSAPITPGPIFVFPPAV